MNENEIKELASQLREPGGSMGLEVGEQLYKTNGAMIGSTIDRIDLTANDVVLEIGHGNGAHVESLFQKEINIVYHGLELSELMYTEAQTINQEYVDSQKAFFKHYNGDVLPYDDQMFDTIFTVNTLYFWDHPVRFLREIRRVLTNNGLFSVAFVSDKTMSELPFSKYGFTVYSEEKFIQLMADNRFDVENLIKKTERVMSNDGETVDREYYIGLMRKN